MGQIDRLHINLRINKNVSLEYWLPLFLISIGFIWFITFFVKGIILFAIPISIYIMYLFGSDNINFVKKPYIFKSMKQKESFYESE